MMIQMRRSDVRVVKRREEGREGQMLFLYHPTQHG